MKLGANDVSAVKIGATDVNKVYLGANLVWQKASPLLLDLYPNAAAAYSLRKLRTAYTGALITVRRSSDNATQDIYAKYDGSLDADSLLTFVGSGDGFVTKRYDQSGNGYDLEQTTASQQPKIVNAGALYTFNGKPYFLNDGVDDYLISITNPTFGTDSRSLFFVQKTNIAGIDSRFNLSDVSGTNTDWLITPEIATRISVKTWISSTPTSIIAPSLISNIYTSGTLFEGNSMWLDGASVARTSGADGTPNTFDKPMLEGGYSPSNILSFDGYISESIIYKSDQSANRAGIESNINEYHNIYWDGSQTGLLDDYPNASAAYSLRALNSAYTGAAIRVRRSSDNEEQDINLLYDGSLNTDSLLSFVGSGDVFVAKWYDQSGNGNDVTQVSAASQPKIVSSGILELLNGKPSVNFINTGDKMNTISTITVSSNFTVFNSNAYSNINYVYGSDSPIASGLISGGTAAGVNGVSVFSNPNFFSYNDSETAAQKLAVLIQNANTNIDVNNAGLISISNVGPIYVESIGNRAPTRSFSVRGNIQECIFFSDDKLATKADIETNINDYYNVY